MFRLAKRCGGFPYFAVWLPLLAYNSPHLSVYFRDYYTEYQVIKECAARAKLTPEDAASAKAAMTKIEAYYLHRDSTIDKAHVRKQAIKNKDAAFKILDETEKVDPREFCLGSLHDLLGKSREIVAGT